MLADTGLLLQNYAGVSAEPLVSEPGEGILEAAAGAGLLVIGLSQRWQQEGLGPVRSEIASRRLRRSSSSGGDHAPARLRRRGT